MKQPHTKTVIHEHPIFCSIIKQIKVFIIFILLLLKYFV